MKCFLVKCFSVHVSQKHQKQRYLWNPHFCDCVLTGRLDLKSSQRFCCCSSAVTYRLIYQFITFAYGGNTGRKIQCSFCCSLVTVSEQLTEILWQNFHHFCPSHLKPCQAFCSGMEHNLIPYKSDSFPIPLCFFLYGWILYDEQTYMRTLMPAQWGWQV